MKRYLYLFLFFGFSCYQKSKPAKEFDAIIHIRFGYEIHSIFLNKNGDGFIKRGRSSYYTAPLQYQEIIDSSDFKIDSINVFFDRLNKLRLKPVLSDIRLDARRIEIYSKQEKIYDTYNMDSTFWNLVKPIMYQIPNRLNPFYLNNRQGSSD